MTTISIVQRVLPHYRISFAERLAALLAQRGIDLRLVYGQERPGTVPATVAVDAPWSVRTRNAYASIGSVELVWQSCLRAIARSDLVIVEQSNRLLVNYLLQARRAWSASKLAFWGHGRNLQSRRPDGLRERLKAMAIRHVDWWFAYTELSRELVIRSGFPSERISVLNNAIDDESLRRGCDALQGRTRAEVAGSLGCRGDNVALFCGSLHAEKRLEFLLDAAHRVRAQIGDFELLIVGDGPQRSPVERAARAHSWIHWFGARTAEYLAPYLHAAKVVLMPGLVGLAIVDSFTAQCPMVTTRYPYHSPEIAYLRDGENGLMTDDDVHSYSRAVVACLQDGVLLETLREGCRRSAAQYSLSAMVRNFADGIEACLSERSL